MANTLIPTDEVYRALLARLEAQEFQHYWRCAHYPSALQNFQENRTACEWECTCVPLKWYHNGTHPMPLSWPARRGVDDYYDVR